jgi:hypothetical protein
MPKNLNFLKYFLSLSILMLNPVHIMMLAILALFRSFKLNPKLCGDKSQYLIELPKTETDFPSTDFEFKCNEYVTITIPRTLILTQIQIALVYESLMGDHKQIQGVVSRFFTDCVVPVWGNKNWFSYQLLDPAKATSFINDLSSSIRTPLPINYTCIVLTQAQLQMFFMEKSVTVTNAVYDFNVPEEAPKSIFGQSQQYPPIGYQGKQAEESGPKWNKAQKPYKKVKPEETGLQFQGSSIPQVPIKEWSRAGSTRYCTCVNRCQNLATIQGIFKVNTTYRCKTHATSCAYCDNEVETEVQYYGLNSKCRTCHNKSIHPVNQCHYLNCTTDLVAGTKFCRSHNGLARVDDKYPCATPNCKGFFILMKDSPVVNENSVCRTCYKNQSPQAPIADQPEISTTMVTEVLTEPVKIRNELVHAPLFANIAEK